MHTKNNWLIYSSNILPLMDFRAFLQLEHGLRHDEVMKFLEGEIEDTNYSETIEKFLKKTFETIQEEIIESREPHNIIISGAFTFFSRETKQPVVHFINWEHAKGRINRGFFTYCQYRRNLHPGETNCQNALRTLEDFRECGNLKECLAEFLNRLHYSASRLIERVLPVRPLLFSLNLKMLSEIGRYCRNAEGLFNELYRIQSGSGEDPLVYKDSSGKPCFLSPVDFANLLDRYRDTLGSETFEALRDIYTQFIESQLFVPDAGIGNDNRGRIDTLLQKNLHRLLVGGEHPYSLQDFVALVLAVATIPEARRFYLLHFGLPFAVEKDKRALDHALIDELTLGNGTLVMYCRKGELKDEVLASILFLANQAILSLAREEGNVLSLRYEKMLLEKERIELLKSAHHSLGTRSAAIMKEIQELQKMNDNMEGMEGIMKAARRLDGLIGNLGYYAQPDREDKWFEDSPLEMSELFNEQASLFAKLTIKGKDVLRDKVISGRRLASDFLRNLFVDIIFNVLEHGISRELEIMTVSINKNGKDYECIAFRNRTLKKQLSSEQLPQAEEGQWETWPEEGKGGLARYAYSLRKSGTGKIFFKWDSIPKNLRSNLNKEEVWFYLGVHLVQLGSREGAGNGEEEL